jgi:drug/metabolite transporter (DMT)-like permease
MAGSALVGESWTVPQQARTGIVVAWLVIVGSVGLFYLVLFVIQRWTASATAYSLALMPVVAVAVGAVLAHEAISVEVAIGAVLVLLAVYVGALTQPSRSRGPRTGASVRSAR